MKKPLVSRSPAPGSKRCTICRSPSVRPHPALPAGAILQVEMGGWRHQSLQPLDSARTHSAMHSAGGAHEWERALFGITDGVCSHARTWARPG